MEELNFSCSFYSYNFKIVIYNPALSPLGMTMFLITVSGHIMKTKQGHREYALAYHTLTCTAAFLVKVPIRALGEALPLHQHMGRPAGCAVIRALPCTSKTGLVTSWKDKAEQTIRKVTIWQVWCSVSPVSIPGLKHILHIHFSFPRTHLTYFFLKAMSCKASICGTQVK